MRGELARATPKHAGHHQGGALRAYRNAAAHRVWDPRLPSPTATLRHAAAARFSLSSSARPREVIFGGQGQPLVSLGPTRRLGAAGAIAEPAWSCPGAYCAATIRSDGRMTASIGPVRMPSAVLIPSPSGAHLQGPVESVSDGRSGHQKTGAGAALGPHPALDGEAAPASDAVPRLTTAGGVGVGQGLRLADGLSAASPVGRAGHARHGRDHLTTSGVLAARVAEACAPLLAIVQGRQQLGSRLAQPAPTLYGGSSVHGMDSDIKDSTTARPRGAPSAILFGTPHLS